MGTPIKLTKTKCPKTQVQRLYVPNPKRPNAKRPKPQNVPTKNPPKYKTSQLQNVLSLCPKSKISKPQNVPILKRLKYPGLGDHIFKCKKSTMYTSCKSINFLLLDICKISELTW